MRAALRVLGVATLSILGLTGLLTPLNSSAQPEAFPHPPSFEGGRLGIRVLPMTPELREHMKAPRDAGVLVSQVEGDSPADAAGIRVGDVLTHAGGEEIAAPAELVFQVARLAEHGVLRVRLVREGETLERSVRVRGRPWPDTGAWRDWLQDRGQEGLDALKRRLDELERRLDELERRAPEPRST